jgi:hypothetical protein
VAKGRSARYAESDFNRDVRQSAAISHLSALSGENRLPDEAPATQGAESTLIQVSKTSRSNDLRKGIYANASAAPAEPAPFLWRFGHGGS